jgi:hypothetical protein
MKYEFYHNFWSERDVKQGRYSRWSRKDILMEDGWYQEDKRDSVYRADGIKTGMKLNGQPGTMADEMGSPKNTVTAAGWFLKADSGMERCTACSTDITPMVN